MIESAVPGSPDERVDKLHARRALKMARSAHAYVRGSTQQFYEWLETSGSTHVPAGPRIWICGDAHVGNVGPVGRGDGPPVLELRDLDQSVIGNPAHDLVRLGLSLAMAARSSDLPGVTTARMTEELVAGYEHAFDGGLDSPEALPGPIKFIMKRALRRTSKDLLAEELAPDRRRPELRLGRRFWPLSDAERATIGELTEQPTLRRLVTQLSGREEDPGAQLEILDAAYWVKGCSSLGLWRAAVLVCLGGGKKKSSMCLLDLKQAVDPVTPHGREDMPADPAERVVIGARHLAPTLGERMVALQMHGRSLFARELMPQDLKLEIDALSDIDARAVAFYLGSLLGRAHARQLDEPARRSWRSELLSRHSKDMHAPSWLWTALVELVAVHERAYLEHCRKYALASAA